MTRALAVGLLALALTATVRAGAPDDLDSMDQAKQGLYVVDAFHEGRWLVPLESGSIFPTKPPLMTWLSLGVALPRGRVDELAARAPSLGAALLMLVATVGFARRLSSTVQATAAVALVANFHVVHAFWLARTDMLLAALTTLATAQTFESALAFARGRDPRRSFVAAAALMGLGTVAKSPVALVCPSLALVLHLGLRRELGAFVRALGAPTLAVAVAAYIIIVGAWLVPATIRGGAPFAETLWAELAGHAAGTGEYAERGKPLWYPFAHFLGSFLPWSVLVALTPPRREAAAEPSDEVLARSFAYAALATSLAFFAAMTVKRADHVLPCYPWAAIACGIGVERWLAGRSRVAFWVFALTGGFALVASVLLPLALRPELLPLASHPKEARAAAELAREPSLILSVAFALAPAGALTLRGALARHLPSALAGTTLVVTAFLALYYLGVSPYVASRKALVVPGFCARVRELVGRERLVLFRVPPSIAFHLERSQPIRFDPTDALRDLDGARGVVTDETGARALLERRPDLTPALESAPWFKTTEQGDVWRLVYLENAGISR
ncbi:MAG TPA: glycosyltransferase family 39 protein [Planctomycetota bacterium]|nr:glycosyltransferase family 39 protein [Planctomycetota bacterium]